MEGNPFFLETVQSKVSNVVWRVTKFQTNDNQQAHDSVAHPVRFEHCPIPVTDSSTQLHCSRFAAFTRRSVNLRVDKIDLYVGCDLRHTDNDAA